MFSQSRINGLLILCASLVASGCAQLQMNPAIPTANSGAIQTTSEAATALPDTISGALMLGSPNAPVRMLLFTNYDCAYCKDFQRNLMSRLRTDFIDTGKLSMRIILLPLQKYPDSERDARILLCGVRSGSGSDVHGRLFAGQTDFPALTDCLEDETYLQQVLAAQHAVTDELDVTLVPTYFINGEKFTGLPEYADIRGQIEMVMKRN